MSHNEQAPTPEDMAKHLEEIESELRYFTGTQDGLLMALRQVEQNGAKKGCKNIAHKIARGEAHIQTLMTERANILEAQAMEEAKDEAES